MNLGTGIPIVKGSVFKVLLKIPCHWHTVAIMQTVVETMTYLKAASTLFTEAERAEIVSAIASDPEAGDLMPEPGGYRKRRSDGPE